MSTDPLPIPDHQACRHDGANRACRTDDGGRRRVGFGGGDHDHHVGVLEFCKQARHLAVGVTPNTPDPVKGGNGQGLFATSAGFHPRRTLAMRKAATLAAGLPSVKECYVFVREETL